MAYTIPLCTTVSGTCFITLRAKLSSTVYCPVSEMTYTVSSGTLNPSIPYHTAVYCNWSCLWGCVFVGLLPW